VELGKLRRAVSGGDGEAIVKLIEEARAGRSRVLGK
jgi:hypothetical protein